MPRNPYHRDERSLSMGTLGTGQGDRIRRDIDHWESEGREKTIGPYKGRLANALSIYPDTLNQCLEVQIKPVGSRPLFILEDTENLLAIEQRNGLTTQQAAHYACLLLRMAGD